MQTVLVTVEVETLSARLMVDAAIGDSVLAVEWPADFGSEGQLVLNGVTYSYDQVDVYGDTVTLVEGETVTAAAVADDPVMVVTASEEDSTIWRAWVDTADSDQALPAIIPVQLRRYYSEGDTQAGSVLTVHENDQGQLEVGDSPTESSTEVDMNVPAGARATIKGVVELGAGIGPPTRAPQVGQSWEHSAAFLDSDMDAAIGNLFGLADGGGASWYTTESFTTGQVWAFSKTTGVRTLALAAIADYKHIGGLCRIGTDWYVLSFKNSTLDWRVRKYNSSWVFQSEWTRAANNTFKGTAMAIATDGTFIYTAYQELTNGFLRVFKQNPDGTVGSTVFTTSVVPTGTVTGLYVGSADFGATRYVITTATKVYVFNASGTRQTGSEWTPANGEQIRGLVWDGTRFHSLASPSGKVWHYSVRPAALNRTVGNTLYDSNASGGTHETTLSPTVTFLQAPRQWMLVEPDPAEYDGSQDSPGSVRVYVDNHLQADLGDGVFSVVYEDPNLASIGAPTTNEFSGVGAPGEFRGGGSDTSGDKVLITGEEVERFAMLTDPWEAWGSSADLTASVTAPNLGTTGTWMGRVLRQGKTRKFYIEWVFGGTGISGGSGTWRVSLPDAPKTGVRWKVEGNAFDGTSDWDISGRWASSVSKLILGCRPTTAGNADRGVSSTAPFAPVAGCRYFIHGEYETD